MLKSRFRLVAAAFCFGIAIQGVLAQTTGTISGTAKDTSGAVLPGVTITVKNLDNGQSRTIVTDDEGRYGAPNLALGQYEVQAELAGFQVAVRSGITLTMGREAEVDFALKVGEVTEKVTVTGEAPLVETSKAELTDLVDTQQIEDLPLNGRSYTQLALMQPGVMTLSSTTGASINGTHGGGVFLSVAGGRPMNTDFTLDGTDIKDALGRTPGSAAGQNLGVDTLREFSVHSSAYSAEFSGSGGVVNTVTKSGTNQLHGSAFEFHRNSALDARHFRDVGSLPPFKRNQFGFTIGGPIVADRTFFFGSYEGLRENLSTTTIITTPNASVRAGILPGVGPITLHPQTKKYLDTMPLPNGLDFGDGRGQYSYIQKRTVAEDYFMVKVDHQFGPSDSFFVRYTFDDAERSDPRAFPGFSDPSSTRFQYVTLEENRIISATLLNTFRFAFNRSLPVIGTLSEGHPANLVEIPLPDRYPPNLIVPGLSDWGTNAFNPRSTLLNTFQFIDKITYTAGAHSIKVGGDFTRYQMNGFSASRKHGRLQFQTFRDFLEGRIRRWEFLVPGTGETMGWRQNKVAFFFQDDIKLRRNFSLNLGLRWEFVTSPYEVAGRIANVRNLLDKGPTIGKPFFNPPKLNLGPRAGLAWDPFGTGKTSVRAGFGLYPQQLTSGTWVLPAVQNEPFFIRAQVERPPFPVPFTITGQLPPSSPTPFEFNPSNPYMMNYNLTLQRQLSEDTVVSASYVGSRGVHLGSHVNFNIGQFTLLPDGRKFWVDGAPRLNPAFGAISFKHFNADSTYNSMQLRLSKRFSGGLQFQTGYTFGRNIDNVSESQGAGILDPYDVGRQRSLSDLHVKHNWNINYSYDLPLFGQGGALAMVLGGWKMNGIVRLSSGNPTSVENGFDRDHSQSDVTGGGGATTPDLKPGANNNPVLGDGRNPDRYLDASPFQLQQEGTFGNLGRNTVIGPGIINFDLSLVKAFRFTESQHLEFRSEFFNIFNRSNYGTPNTTVFTAATGGPSASFGIINGLNTPPRQIQLAVKYVF